MPSQPSELFRSTARYYARYRPGYPPEFFDYLEQELRLDGTQRVMDLGCGSGQIAIPLAGRVGEVVAVDPEPSMLAEGRRRCVANVTWLRGDSYRLADLGVGEVDAVTMGASFHWMDRDAVLVTLDGMVRSGGAVVLASGGPPGSVTPPSWQDVITQVRTRWLGPRRRAGSGVYVHPADPHEVVLRRSAFSQVRTADWTVRVDRGVEEVVDLQFSYSYSAPALFGDNQAAFADELRAELLRVVPSGVFTEDVHTQAIVARRVAS